jgi:mRNA interferase MazF
MDVCQGDIYWVDIPFAHTAGSEQAGRRPFIVVSRDAVNRLLKTVVVVPMSTTIKNQSPFRIVIPVAEITKELLCTTVLHPSVAKADQVRVIDKARLQEKIGRLSRTATLAVLLGIGFVFNIR